MRSIRVLIPIAAILLLALLCGAAPAPQTAPESAAAGEKLLRDLEARFARSVAEKDRDAFLAFWAKDAAIFPPSGGPAIGPGKVWEHWASILEDKDVSLTWKPSRVEMAASGDLGYTYGRYESKRKGPAGEVVTHGGAT